MGSPGEVGAQQPGALQHYSHGVRMGGAGLCPHPRGVAGRLSSLWGVITITGGKGRLGSGGVTVRSDLGTDLEGNNRDPLSGALQHKNTPTVWERARVDPSPSSSWPGNLPVGSSKPKRKNRREIGGGIPVTTASSMFRWDIWKNCFSERAVLHWHRLPRDGGLTVLRTSGMWH